jgi:hypothetical protein
MAINFGRALQTSGGVAAAAAARKGKKSPPPTPRDAVQTRRTDAHLFRLLCCYVTLIPTTPPSLPHHSQSRSTPRCWMLTARRGQTFSNVVCVSIVFATNRSARFFTQPIRFCFRCFFFVSFRPTRKLSGRGATVEHVVRNVRTAVVVVDRSRRRRR